MDIVSMKDFKEQVRLANPIEEVISVKYSPLSIPLIDPNKIEPS